MPELEVPTSFNAQVKIILDHAKGSDILAVLSRQQQFVINRQSLAIGGIINGDPTAYGRFADSAAQAMELSMLFFNFCNEVVNRVNAEESARQKAEAKQSKLGAGNNERPTARDDG